MQAKALAGRPEDDDAAGVDEGPAAGSSPEGQSGGGAGRGGATATGLHVHAWHPAPAHLTTIEIAKSSKMI